MSSTTFFFFCSFWVCFINVFVKECALDLGPVICRTVVFLVTNGHCKTTISLRVVNSVGQDENLDLSFRLCIPQRTILFCVFLGQVGPDYSLQNENFRSKSHGIKSRMRRVITFNFCYCKHSCSENCEGSQIYNSIS